MIPIIDLLENSKKNLEKFSYMLLWAIVFRLVVFQEHFLLLALSFYRSFDRKCI